MKKIDLCQMLNGPLRLKEEEAPQLENSAGQRGDEKDQILMDTRLMDTRLMDTHLIPLGQEESINTKIVTATMRVMKCILPEVEDSL